MNDVSDFCRITPRWGFHLRNVLSRRALPYANDFWAFSPKIVKNVKAAKNDFPLRKAESLLINSVGQRPTERNVIKNLKPQRGVINLVNY